MRVLYIVSKQWKFEKEDDTKYRNLYWDEIIHYGELPDDGVTVYDDFSDAIKYFDAVINSGQAPQREDEK